MKIKHGLLLVLVVVSLISCRKSTGGGPSPISHFNPVIDFLEQFAPKIQVYTINANAGGSFTTPQGTTVTIPSNAFTTKTGTAVNGNVMIQFKDIYKKSDMLYANLPTAIYYGAPLKSGGEFYIKAIQNNNTLILASGKRITVAQSALLTGGLDTLHPQQAFALQDTSFCSGGCPNSWQWVPSPGDTVKTVAQDYIFNMYQFNSPIDSGSWCNSDNSTYFSAYPQTHLTLLAKDTVADYGTNVFLFFTGLSSMVHVYGGGYEYFPYYYAPQGLQCTVVAVGVKNGQLYSSFVPITIGSNQTITFTLSPTTTSTFTTQVQALN